MRHVWKTSHFAMLEYEAVVSVTDELMTLRPMNVIACIAWNSLSNDLAHLIN